MNYVFVFFGAALAILIGACISYWVYKKEDMIIAYVVSETLGKVLCYVIIALGIAMVVFGVITLVFHP